MKQKLLKKKVLNVAKLFVISLALCTSNNAVAMNNFADTIEIPKHPHSCFRNKTA